MDGSIGSVGVTVKRNAATVAAERDTGAVVEPAGVDAVVFDWGGTLTLEADVDLLDLWLAAATHLDPAHAGALADRLLAVEAADWEDTRESLRAGTLDQLITRAAVALGVEVADAVRAEAASLHLQAWAVHLTHDPDAVPTLTALRERGLRIGLLSNTHWPRHFHEELLARDGLIDLIDVGLYTSELTYRKPHPSVFRAVVEALAADGTVAAASTVFVGDRPFDDISGAKGVGMRAVLRPNPTVPGGPVEPEARISSLPELLPLIDAWRGE